MAKHLTLLALLLSSTSALAQAPAPPGRAAEAAAPFSWYLVPSDVLGFKDCPQGFQVTYDGAFNNGFGELDLEAGSKLAPVNQRVKTLYRDSYPILEYSFKRDGALYHVESFGATWFLDPRADLVAFIRVTISNPGKAPIHSNLRATYGPRREFGRASLPCRPWYQAKFMDAQVFKASSEPAMEDGVATRSGHALFLYSGHPQVDSSKLSATYALDLKPGEKTAVDLRVPFVPLRISEVSTLRGMGFDDYFARTVKFWDGVFGKATALELHDPKVTNAMRANLAYDLIARDVEADGTHFTQTVNKFQYHGFFMRDTSFIAHSYDLLNLPQVARETVERYLIRDRSGRVTSLRRESPDDWGQSLWAVGAHFEATGDLAFARDVHPALAAHLDEFEDVTSKDPLHLWPVAGPYDNELIDGHYTSHNLWALLGLRETETLCRAVGDDATANRARRLYDAFYKVFVARLAKLAATDEGYIPPGMDDPLAGHDWENASGGVYPFRVFPPFHPWVTATVNMEREYKYREGIMTWGPNAWKGKVAALHSVPFDPLYLHDYDTFQVTEACLARDEQQHVIEDLYSTLVHTSSTHAGFETSIRPWDNRDPDGNFPPHGWFAARYNELVRNMVLREDGSTLHLASALSPQWIKPGQTMQVRRGATTFGSIDYSIESRVDGASVRIASRWRVEPAAIVFHVPWFVRASSATVDGRAVSIRGGKIVMGPKARLLALKWRRIEQPDLTYARAVQLWLQKAYDPKPGEDTDHLFPTLTRPGLADPNTLFVGSYNLRLVSRSGKGSIHYTLDGSTPTSRSPVFRKPVRLNRTTLIRAVEIWPGNQTSAQLYAKVEAAQFQAPVSPDRAVQPGLAYRYFEGDFPAMPDFSKLTPTSTGVGYPDLDAIKHRPERFAFSISGFVKAPRDGIYTFVMGSDDGSKLWIDGRLIVDNDGAHAYHEAQGQIALRAGLHRIEVSYFDSGGAAYLRLFWAEPGVKREPIPTSVIFH